MQTEEKEEIFQGYLTEEEKQQIFNEGIKEGEKEVKKVREKIAKNLIKQGDSPEKIAKATNMSMTEVIALAQQ